MGGRGSIRFFESCLDFFKISRGLEKREAMSEAMNRGRGREKGITIFMEKCVI